MKTSFFRYFRKKGRGVRRIVRNIIKSRWLITIFIIFFLISISFGIANNVYIYYLEKNNVNIFQIKNLILQFVKTNLNKAIEIGTVSVNIVDGVSLEDIRISAEEDFSNNKILFSSTRMDLKLNSIFSKSKQLEKIVFHNAKLEIEQDVEIQNFSKYLLENNLPSVEFNNLILIVKKENQIFFRTTKPLHLILQRKRDVFLFQGNDALILNNLFKQVQLQGELNLSNSEFNLKVQIDNFPVEKISGITKSVSLLDAQEGNVSGFVQYYSSLEEKKMDGSLNFYSVSGYLSSIQVYSLTWNTQFSYFSNKRETYFNRKLNNPYFICDISYHERENGSILNRVSGSFENLEKLNWSREDTPSLKIGGRFDFELSLEEFLKGNEAFQIFGNLTVLNLSIYDEGTKLKLLIHEGGLRTTSSGELKASLKGSLFSQNFNLELSGNLKYLRTQEPKNYLVQSNLESNLQLEKYIQTDYELLIGKLIQIIENSIREQQEKMYLETYIVASPLFKKFFEQANFQLLLKIRSFQNSKEEKDLGSLTGKLNYSKNNFYFKLISNLEPPFLDVELKGILEKRNPYYDLRIKCKSYPLRKIFIDFCGYGIFPAELDLDFSLQTSGNNFSDMLARKSFNLDFELKDFQWKLINPQIASDFFIFQTSNWTSRGGFFGHGFEGYFRSLELFSETASFKGYGNTTKFGSFQFNFWGQNSGNYINWSVITNGGEKCQFSIK